MLLFMLVYLGGALTILSPCILPVLPFVFARAGQPFLRSGLPMLGGLALGFAGIATLAAVAGGWAVAVNQHARTAALILLGLFGATLLWPALGDRLMRPFTALGGRLLQSAEGREGLLPSLLIGLATGLIWAPCAGPVLGLILTGAALEGASLKTSLLLLTYAAGAASSLTLALLAGARIAAALRRSLAAGEWLRRVAGAAVLVAVAGVAAGLDTGMLTRASLASTTVFEQGLLDKLGLASANDAPAMEAGPAMMSGDAMMGGDAMMMTGNPAMMMTADKPGAKTPATDLAPLESLAGITAWLNTPPLKAESLRGKVVLIDFWTYSCINCLRSLPYVQAWARKYREQGLVVIGVHAPEFAFEKDLGNVKRAVSDLKIDYPVALDNDYAVWRAFSNRYWPAHYFIGADGRIRHKHFGEGGYDESERVIQQLLAEAGAGKIAADLVAVKAGGAQAAAATQEVYSPETYVGHARAQNFASPDGLQPDRRHRYEIAAPRLNEWALAGEWTVGDEDARLDSATGELVYRFHARDLHLVLGAGKPVRFRVTLDGKPPGKDRGADVDADGQGRVVSQRLYQLIRQAGGAAEREFEIRFIDPGVRVYAFTFG